MAKYNIILSIDDGNLGNDYSNFDWNLVGKAFGATVTEHSMVPIPCTGMKFEVILISDDFPYDKKVTPYEVRYFDGWGTDPNGAEFATFFNVKLGYNQVISSELWEDHYLRGLIKITERP